MDTAPATEKQLSLLKRIAEKIGEQVPIGLTKQDASNLIQEWFLDHPDLEAEYEAERERRAEEKLGRDEFEMLVHSAISNAEDWAELVGASKVPDREQAARALRITGGQRHGEGIDAFMRRFFFELRQMYPGEF